jgi:hypothetical protein
MNPFAHFLGLLPPHAHRFSARSSSARPFIPLRTTATSLTSDATNLYRYPFMWP